MSELSNPLFENERELLERQKEEYRNALMGDVDQIKTQSQQIGKKVAIAGGVLLAGYLLSSMFSGGKKKAKKVKKAKEPLHVSHNAAAETSVVDYDSMLHEQEDDYTLSSERMPHAEQPEHKNKSAAKSFMDSGFTKLITSQLTALLMVYITKKVEEYLQSVSENPDIAAKPVEATEIQTTEYNYPEEDAI
ncbi:hypothetical protein [Pontibacter vulgaris]|uniref:hypothetical protein n=1 Tax=Pontibacter vulgaris TaxID=2905679 RepID=UPI001FA71D62|nr:hypothetical protein [Pontibacter vulgaris]